MTREIDRLFEQDILQERARAPRLGAKVGIWRRKSGLQSLISPAPRVQYKSYMEAPRRYRWVMLALAFLLALTSCFLAFSYPPLIPAMISDIRMTHAQAGLVFSVLVLAVMASRIPWGLACDRVGLKTTLGFAAVLMALFGLLRGSATDYGMVLACQLLFGVGYAGVMPCLPRLVAEWFPGRETGFATGLYMAGFSLGIIVGLGFTHHLLALLGGWRGVFYTYGALGMISAIVWWALSRRSEAEAPSAGREALTGAGVVEAVKMR
ncbi:TPA: MFS transporter, partial [Candidatus Bathyarchaeota archaeon]|nr:MFS transporter [Candidatus Bathyarchaeota archaeon]